jgi:hypothetical protein
MPVSIADFNRQRRTFTMESDLGPVQWTYFPYRMTLAREAEIQRISAEMVRTANSLQVAADANDAEAIVTLSGMLDQGHELLVGQFCELVAATDMVGPLHAEIDPVTMEGIGEPIVPAWETIPIKPETVRHFSSRYIREVLDAITVDARPKETPTPTR